MKYFKWAALSIGLFGAIFVAYLLVPAQILGGGRVEKEHFGKTADIETPTGVVKCESSEIYVFEKDRAYYETEDYKVVVDDHCAGLQKQLVDAINNADKAAVEEAIRSGANVNAIDRSTGDPVYPLNAVSLEDLQILKLLLDSGADVNREYCCCASCHTILSKAVEYDKPAAMALALQYGANPDYLPINE